VHIAILDDYQHAALDSTDWKRLPKDAEVRVFSDHLSDRDALVERLQPFDVVVAMRERTAFPAAVIERLPRLRLICTTGPNNAAIDIDAAKRRGIVVCGTDPGGVRSATAELTWGLILALARHIVAEDAAVRAGRWQIGMGKSLHGSVIGILGLGHLGAQVAAYARAFRMELLAWSSNLDPATAEKHGARRVELDELLARADFVTIHLKLSGRTRGLIGTRELGLMKPTAYIVNTSRGPVIDEAALVEALRGKRIAGAGLDTFDEEPLPAGHPLLSLPNVVLTPHVGYVIDRTYREWYGESMDNILAFAAGKPIRVIDKPADYDAGIR
jgi:phosphoglycerate dehydrogenase-like enzyme